MATVQIIQTKVAVLVGRVLASTLPVLKELASQGSTGVIESLTARMERMRGAAVMNLHGEMKYRKTVITNNGTPTGAGTPIGIAVDPARGRMYWTDQGTESGVPAKVAAADMDGSNAVNLFTNNLDHIEFITIDIRENKLYWAVTASGVIERGDPDGTNRITVVTGLSHPWGIAVYNQYLYFTDRDYEVIERVDKATGANRKVLRDNVSGLRVLKVHHRETSAGSSNGCTDNVGVCQQLCLPRPAGQYSCACATGFKLNPDSRTCSPYQSYVIISMLLALKGFSLEGSDHSEAMVPVAGRGRNVLHVDVHMPSGFIYWCDFSNNVPEQNGIRRIKPDGSYFRNIVTSGIGQNGIRGIAIDWGIYFTNAFITETYIEVVRLNTTYRRVLLKTTVDMPRHIVVDPKNRYLFWADYGQNPKIERACLDGTNRTVLVSSGILTPRGLAVDYQNGYIYWVDDSLDMIARIRPEGGETEIVRFGSRYPTPYGITIFENTMLWVDRNLKKVFQARKEPGNTEQPTIVRDNINLLRDVTVFDSRTQPLSAQQVNNNPCLLGMLQIFKKIERCSLTGSNREVIVSTAIYPFAMTVYDQHIYWTDWNTKSIYRANKHDGSDQIVMIQNLPHRPMDIHVLSSNKQQQCSNPCDQFNRGCSHICTPGPNGAECQCPSEGRWYLADNKYCIQDNGTRCPPDQFTCMNGRCVRAQWKCDNDNDCGDGTFHTCDPTLFTCGNGRCVPYHYRCDYYNDCVDNSDEAGCLFRSCDQNTEFICSNGRCISLEYVCNGINNCYDNGTTDERNCPERTCQPGFTKCQTTNICIPRSYLCDGDNDCGDMSDEGLTHCTTVTCTDNEFRCSSGRCIPAHWYCDEGIDCADGSDEPATCDLNGHHRHTVYDGTLPHPFSITVFEDTLYWTDWNTRTVEKRNKYDRSGRTALVNTTHRPFDIHVYHPYRQPILTNPCSVNNGGCSHLCLIKNGGQGYSCECPNNFVTVQLGGIARCLPMCSSTQYRCADNERCVPIWWKCDGQRDCRDGSDEPSTCPPRYCPVGQFQCNDGNCTSPHFLCNTMQECRDGSDEEPVLCACHQCEIHQWQCSNRKCVPEAWQCDGDNDCGDNSDEDATHCSTRTCPPGQFKCNNGRCVPQTWKCDVDDDCGDSSDEPHDECMGPAYRCDNHTEFDCKTNYRCVPLWSVCNGYNDCRDNSDEQGCKELTCDPLGDFRCDNHQCVPLRWKCDGDNDCGDGSDERGCSPRVCTESEYRCDNLHCIPDRWVCDHDNDCEDNSDERDCDLRTCHPGYFQCNSGHCIAERFKCDGNADCLDYSDELTCRVFKWSFFKRKLKPGTTFENPLYAEMQSDQNMGGPEEEASAPEPSPFSTPAKPQKKERPSAFTPTEDTFRDTANLVKEDSDV
ncbi:UNVERIFIED_CONTAM: hypothetical protein FKN15_067608 [Acipenser sinensis]